MKRLAPVGVGEPHTVGSFRSLGGGGYGAGGGTCTPTDWPQLALGSVPAISLAQSMGR